MQIKLKLAAIAMMTLLMTERNNVTADNMNYVIKKIWVPLLFFMVGMSVGCGQVNNHELTKDQKQILNLYSKEYLFSDQQYLYFKSVEKNELIGSLNPPLMPQDFKLPQVALKPGKSQRSLDTLFTGDELDSWDSELRAYKQIKWVKELFPEQVKFISKEKIPDYLSHTDIPPRGQKRVFLHYISIPFVFKEKSALLYSKKWSSGANVKVRYYYFIKNGNDWEISDEGPLNIGY